MMPTTVLRRAQPWLGTVVEIGVPLGCLGVEAVSQAIADAFGLVAQVHRLMSRFDPDSDVSRFHRAAVGEPLRINQHTRQVLAAARQLAQHTGGLFDVAMGTGTWSLDERGSWVKHDAQVQVDLGGIAKGYAVDVAIEALAARDIGAAWVNAGGDLRVMGTSVPVDLRNETQGGVQRWAEIEDAAVATSYFGAGARAALHGPVQASHVTVVAPQCMWADALTKVIAQVGLEKAEPWLPSFEARAWVHA